MKSNDKITKQKKKKHVVLAFSGGLDTSFCVLYLIKKGYLVTSVFVDSGGVSIAEKKAISERAFSLGVIEHKVINIGSKLFNQIITPLIQAGEWYQGEYPLLCSDRYLIVEACLKICDQIGTQYFAHGCTGMGNDQVRFDLAVQCLGEYQVLSPIRELQQQHQQVRDFEIQYLRSQGFSVSDKVSNYSVNENLLGSTISGSEIDQWQIPTIESFILTKPANDSLQGSKLLTLTFQNGIIIALNNKYIDKTYTSESLIKELNCLVGNYSVGRGIYTGDTTIGIKGRIVFEAPALTALKTAHKALEQTVLSKPQNRFKSIVAKKWTELVYEGLFYDPLKLDLESFIQSSQKMVTGKVTLELSQGQVHAVAIDSNNTLKDKGSIYAQTASWNLDEAAGFIKLFGKSSVLAAKINTNAD